MWCFEELLKTEKKPESTAHVVHRHIPIECVERALTCRQPASVSTFSRLPVGCVLYGQTSSGMKISMTDSIWKCVSYLPSNLMESDHTDTLPHVQMLCNMTTASTTRSMTTRQKPATIFATVLVVILQYNKHDGKHLLLYLLLYLLSYCHENCLTIIFLWWKNDCYLLTYKIWEQVWYYVFPCCHTCIWTILLVSENCGKWKCHTGSI